MSVKKKLSVGMNFAIALAVLAGVLLSMIFAQRDGYSHWSRRLFYFTQLSNVWIGVTCGTVAIATLLEARGKTRVKRYVYLLKYIFTVSITITGLIFCGLLAPFADYDVWSTGSVLVHVVVPILSIADFFLYETDFVLKGSHVFLSLLPPLFYFIFASVLGFCGVDFGRGDPYPYFFMNYKTEVGLFGFSNDGELPQMGSFYWILFISLLVLFFAWLYYKIRVKQRKKADKQ